MRKILITGGTIFVSEYIAEYYVNKGDDVYVFNRNTHHQLNGVKLIKGDKNFVCDELGKHTFDLVIAANIYNKKEMENLTAALSEIRDMVFISSSAVYPETIPLPFKESDKTGYNSIWQQYGTGKCEAEEFLSENFPCSYIIRPPYLYGKYQNLYREAFVFDCAIKGLPFYIPKGGKMNLHFFNVSDLCAFIDVLIEKRPKEKIFNVGNPKPVSINEFVEVCYQAAGAKLIKKYVDLKHNQRSYFPFYDYDYYLDVTRQSLLLSDTTSLYDGLKESFEWYKENQSSIQKKNYLEYISKNLSGLT